MEHLSHAGRHLLDRRGFLGTSATALGSIALVELLRRDRLLVAETSEDPYAVRIDATRPHAPRWPHHAASGTNVLVIFASGACSHLDTWDYKPELIRRDELPAFVAIPDLPGVPQSSLNNWGAGFLPAVFQGTSLSAFQPIRHLTPPAGMTSEADRATRNFLQQLNARHLARFKTLKEQYDVHGPILDQPAAGLIQDLKQRGLLEHTLVVWCTEFGRMPTFQKGASGRDHNPHAFTAWLCGAGVKAPFSFGATDEFGFRAVEDVLTVHDLHATILHLLGLRHERLTYYHNGIQRRLTDVHGHVIREILA